MNDNRLIDWSVARQTVQGDEQLLKELISTFLEEIPRLLQTMRSATESADATSLRRAAHTLKGALGHFGARGAYQAALRVESHSREGDVALAAEALPALCEAMAELTPVLVNYLGGNKATQGE